MKTNKNTQKYRIVASCNPYHARLHYRNQEVLRRDGVTPTEWVHNDGYGIGLSLTEAMNILDSFACELGDDAYNIDDDCLALMVQEYRDECDEDLDTSWYKGEGWYVNECLVYKHGDMALSDDVMTYSIEPF